MAKRRKMGLGGSVAHHAAEARSIEREVPQYYTDAFRDATAGHCNRAVRTLETAAEAFGMAVAHAREGKVRVSHLTQSREKAHAAIAKHCIIGGGLSGMRRRRSRK